MSGEGREGTTEGQGRKGWGRELDEGTQGSEKE